MCCLQFSAANGPMATLAPVFSVLFS
uniref:Uncharacterized protein n=1 Tax=Anguilla anguilla TaxID=7936 RepID=A0A0E9QL22_ANGAN